MLWYVCVLLLPPHALSFTPICSMSPVPLPREISLLLFSWHDYKKRDVVLQYGSIFICDYVIILVFPFTPSIPYTLKFRCEGSIGFRLDIFGRTHMSCVAVPPLTMLNLVLRKEASRHVDLTTSR